MGLLGEIKSWLGAPFRWALARIRGDEERRQGWLVEIVDALATAVARADRIGIGEAWEDKFKAELREAASLAGGRAALIGDPTLADSVNGFRQAADTFLDSRTRQYRNELRSRQDDVLDVILALRAGKKKR
jgi:hypothetical protein